MIIDGLQCGYFTRDVFEELRQGGVGAVTTTLGFWEGAVESLDAIGQWRELARANADVFGIARTAAEITAIAESGRVAALLGFQNASSAGQPHRVRRAVRRSRRARHPAHLQ